MRTDIPLIDPLFLSEGGSISSLTPYRGVSSLIQVDPAWVRYERPP